MVLIRIPNLVKLHPLTIELLFDDEFVVRVFSLGGYVVGGTTRTVALHRLEDVAELLRAPSEHGTEDATELDGRVLQKRAQREESATGRREEETAHLPRDPIVWVVKLPADALDVGAGVKDLHRVGVELVEDCLLPHADLEVCGAEKMSGICY
jgi:hypothetical protein